MDKNYFDRYKQWIETIVGECNEKNRINVKDGTDTEHYVIKRFACT